MSARSVCPVNTWAWLYNITIVPRKYRKQISPAKSLTTVYKLHKKTHLYIKRASNN